MLFKLFLADNDDVGTHLSSALVPFHETYSAALSAAVYAFGSPQLDEAHQNDAVTLKCAVQEDDNIVWARIAPDNWPDLISACDKIGVFIGGQQSARKMTSNVITQDLPIPTASPGFADIVGFGQDGVTIMRNAINVQSFLVVKMFGQNAGGWLTTKHVRLVADVTGDKKGDIVGFGDGGVWISVDNGNNNFTKPSKMVVTDFAYFAGGWRIEKHIRYMADIRNIGRADIVGFGDGGVLVSRNNGGLSFGPVTLLLNDFGYVAGGWRIERHLRFLADVTGDGSLDIIGFGEQHVFTSRNTGGNFGPVVPVLNNFCIAAGGWQIGAHPRFVADLTGDGKADIIGCGNAGVYTSLNNGSGGFGPVTLVLKHFGTAQGWQVAKHPRFIADLTGDRRGDIIGFGDEGVYVSLNNGNGIFQAAKFVLKCFGTAQGWLVEKHPRFVVDLTGDGCADIIGFGENSTYVSFNDGKGDFAPVKILTSDFSFSGGQWAVDNTVRWMANLDNGRF